MSRCLLNANQTAHNIFFLNHIRHIRTYKKITQFNFDEVEIKRTYMSYMPYMVQINNPPQAVLNYYTLIIISKWFPKDRCKRVNSLYRSVNLP